MVRGMNGESIVFGEAGNATEMPAGQDIDSQ
jgi:hypothetical protein